MIIYFFWNGCLKALFPGAISADQVWFGKVCFWQNKEISTIFIHKEFILPIINWVKDRSADQQKFFFRNHFLDTCKTEYLQKCPPTCNNKGQILNTNSALWESNVKQTQYNERGQSTLPGNTHTRKKKLQPSHYIYSKDCYSWLVVVMKKKINKFIVF